jgi:hypothetical protein
VIQNVVAHFVPHHRADFEAALLKQIVIKRYPRRAEKAGYVCAARVV